MISSQGVCTRLATDGDAATICQIYNLGIEDRLATFETHLRSEQEVRRALADRGETHPTVVAERDGQVVGCAWVTPYRSRPCYAGIGEFSVYTDRAARGSGIGTAVMESLLEECEQHGFWKLVSRIFPENVASRKLCKRLGFREVGVYCKHAKLHGEWRDCIIVERLLGEAG